MATSSRLEARTAPSDCGSPATNPTPAPLTSGPGQWRSGRRCSYQIRTAYRGLLCRPPNPRRPTPTPNKAKRSEPYIRWRNREALPKLGFAINSKFRSSDYQANLG
ncbi:hypothetical protein Lfu02_78630 [Longispora fulva]|nr:hypothetical protein Lfu02_78630 [Longispora fulva]